MVYQQRGSQLSIFFLQSLCLIVPLGMGIFKHELSRPRILTLFLLPVTSAIGANLCKNGWIPLPRGNFVECSNLAAEKQYGAREYY